MDARHARWRVISHGARAAFALIIAAMRCASWAAHTAFPSIEFLVGRGEASEEAIDETRFRMIMTIKHRLFGILYSYHGTFQITEVDLER